MYGVSVVKSKSDDARRSSVVGESRLQPPVRLAAGVDRLAVVEVVGDHRGWPARPALVGDNGLDVAVGEFDLELREGSKLVAVESAASTPGQASTKPTIAESESETDVGRRSGVTS